MKNCKDMGDLLTEMIEKSISIAYIYRTSQDTRGWSKKNIQRILNNLYECRLIKKTSHNDKKSTSHQGKTVRYTLTEEIKNLVANSKDNPTDVLELLSALYLCQNADCADYQEKFNLISNFINYSIIKYSHYKYTIETHSSTILQYGTNYNFTFKDDQQVHNFYFLNTYKKDNSIYYLLYNNINTRFILKHTDDIQNRISTVIKLNQENIDIKIEDFIDKKNVHFTQKYDIELEVSNSLLEMLDKSFFRIKINSNINDHVTSIILHESYNFLFPFLKMNINQIRIKHGDSILIDDLRRYFQQINIDYL